MMRGERLPKMGYALLIGTACGFLANWIGMPLPWMLGPMIGNTLAAVLRAPVLAPIKLRPIVVPVLGVMLGSSLNMELISQVGRWTATIALMPFFLAVAGVASYLFYRRVAQFDHVTAFFSAMPGGLNDMMIMGGAAGGDEQKIALAHSSRILVVVLFVGLFYGFALDVQATGPARPFVGMSSFGMMDLIWLAAAAILGVPFGKFLRLPAGQMLGPMILSGALHLMGLVELPPPTVLVIAAQIVLGTVIGCRFVGTPVAQIGRNVGFGLASSALMLAATLGFAGLLASVSEVQQTQAFLAYSPGGLTEMSLLALAMGQEVAYVSVAHVVRIMIVIFGAPLAFRAIGALEKDAGA